MEGVNFVIKGRGQGFPPVGESEILLGGIGGEVWWLESLLGGFF